MTFPSARTYKQQTVLFSINWYLNEQMQKAFPLIIEILSHSEVYIPHTSYNNNNNY